MCAKVVIQNSHYLVMPILVQCPTVLFTMCLSVTDGFWPFVALPAHRIDRLLQHSRSVRTGHNDPVLCRHNQSLCLCSLLTLLATCALSQSPDSPCDYPWIVLESKVDVRLSCCFWDTSLVHLLAPMLSISFLSSFSGRPTYK